MRSSLNVGATQVANEFIDRYMPEANGEYVKVYLYLLRHEGRQVTVLELADALDRTESDIRRALAYWERLGVLTAGGREKSDGAAAAGAAQEAAGQPFAGVVQDTMERMTAPAAWKTAGQTAAGTAQEAAERMAAGAAQDTAGQPFAEVVQDTMERMAAPAAQDTVGQAAAAAPDMTERSAENVQPDTRIPAQRPVYTPEQVKALSEDEEFTQLLYVAQKYLNRVFTPRECEVFAYLYDGLRMPAELLEYLVEYCVQGAHTGIRYIETVGLNWHEKGIHTVEAAKQHTSAYSNEAFAVMRAFGLSDRRPGNPEMEMIHRWFKEWGFTKELVLEACARTLIATNRPSFAYADRILMEWKKSDVRTMADVRRLDEAREKARSTDTAAKGGETRTGSANTAAQTAGAGSRGTVRTAAAAGARNRFHNFEQRNTDYDAIVLRQVKERLGKQG